MTSLGSQPADFIRASSHTVLREQAEHMDAPDRCSSLNKSSCAAGVVHTWRHLPLFLRAVQDQIEQLGGGIIAGEVSPGPDRPPELGVQRLDGVGCVEDFAHRLGEGEVWDHLGPDPPPALADGWVALAPFAGLEGAQRRFGALASTAR